MYKKNSKGFTLIELLIVIAIIAIIAGVVFVALDPLKRFQDSRDARRWADTSNLLSAIKVSQVDNKGYYIPAIAADTASNTAFMIGTASGANCVISNCSISTKLTPTGNNCINFAATELVTKGYLGAIPVSPSGVGSWSDALTGYVYYRASSTGAITIAACENEGKTNNPNGILVTR
jgi:prepilin-type N-terminal cleavage/methylation domain-containing protein